MDIENQDLLIAKLGESLFTEGVVTDESVKALFEQKNEIADEEEGTSYEFDTFFANTVMVWIGEELTQEKADFLNELIGSDDGALDDSEDALLETIADKEAEEELIVCESFKEAFEAYF